MLSSERRSRASIRLEMQAVRATTHICKAVEFDGSIAHSEVYAAWRTDGSHRLS
jgi:hypothetical protein